MSEGEERSGLVSAAGAVAVLVAMLAFLPIIQGGRWWFTSLVFVVVAAAVSALGRRIGLPTAAGALVALASLPLVAVAVTGGGLLVVLPTADAARSVLDLLAAATTQIAVDTVPAGDTAGLALFVGVGAGVAAVAVDAVAVGLRAPIAGMLLVLALALVPGKALSTGTNGLLLVALAACVLLVIAADRSRRGRPPRLPGLAAGGAVALAIALLAQVVLPTPAVSEAQTPAPALFGSGADPLVRLGQNLRRGADTPVLRYTTGKGAQSYLRLGVLEDFRGETWTPNGADGAVLNEGQAPVPPGVDPTRTSGRVTTVVEPLSPSAISQRLPLPYAATAVTGAHGAFTWEDRGSTLVRDGSGDVGTYAVESIPITATAASLRGASASRPSGDFASLELPPGVPSIIRRTADAWTRRADSPYAAAVAIQNRLRNGVFAYDEDTPAKEGYDGDGLGVIARFLTVKAGYCVHFASTMAVMARLQGIPSRIVVGYQPGDATAGAASRLVTTDDLHAWPELYFDGVGWVRFEPTPGRGSVPSYAPLPAVKGATTPTPTPAASALPTTSPEQQAREVARQRDRDLAAVGVGALRVGGVAALVLLVLAVPGVSRRLVRRRRLARMGPGGAEGAWRELVDSITDLGLPAGRGRSPREAESVIADGVGPSAGARSALRRLRVGYERHAYGPGSADGSADDVVTVVRAASDRVRRSRRLLAAAAPRSLLGTLARSRLRAGA